MQIIQSPQLIWALVVTIVVLNVLDIITTVRALRLSGKEANPVIRVLISIWPQRPWLGLFVGKAMLVGIGYYFVPLPQDQIGLVYTLSGVAALYAAVVLHNTLAIKYLEH